MTTLFVMLVGAILYITQAIDYATNAAARDILTGAAQTNSVTASTFTQSLCGRLPPGITCANLIVNLYTVTEASQPGGYYTYVKSDTSGLTIPALTPGMGTFNLGKQGDYQYLQVIYPITFLPSGFASILSGGATFNGQAAYSRSRRRRSATSSTDAARTRPPGGPGPPDPPLPRRGARGRGDRVRG